MAEMQFAEKVEILRGIANSVEYCAGKLGPMEARQCDSDARGTDAARMAEQWASGLDPRPPKTPQKI